MEQNLLEKRVEKLESKVDEMNDTIIVFGESIKRFDRAIDKLDTTLEKMKEQNSINIVEQIKKNWLVLVVLGILIAQAVGYKFF